MAHAATNDKMLAKVQALLAKAESTPFTEEAAAFVAKSTRAHDASRDRRSPR